MLFTAHPQINNSALWNFKQLKFLFFHLSRALWDLSFMFLVPMSIIHTGARAQTHTIKVLNNTMSVKAEQKHGSVIHGYNVVILSLCAILKPTYEQKHNRRRSLQTPPILYHLASLCRDELISVDLVQLCNRCPVDKEGIFWRSALCQTPRKKNGGEGDSLVLAMFLSRQRWACWLECMVWKLCAFKSTLKFTENGVQLQNQSQWEIILPQHHIFVVGLADHHM